MSEKYTKSNLLLSFFGSLLFLVFSLVFPSHLATTDVALLEYAGKDTSTIEDGIKHSINRGMLGPVELLKEWSGSEAFDAILKEAYDKNPISYLSGGPAPYYEQYLSLIKYPVVNDGNTMSLMRVVIPRENRAQLLSYLESSRIETLQTILDTRGLSAVNRFMPVFAASGAPLEASILTTALLVQGAYLKDEVMDELQELASQSLSGNVQAIDRLEQFYLSVLGMGYRLNWGQFTRWSKNCHDVNAFIRSISLIHEWPEHFSLFYTASVLIEDFGSIAKYVEKYNTDEIIKDLEVAMKYGRGGLLYLIEQNRPVYHARGWMKMIDQWKIFPSVCYHLPVFSLILKFFGLFFFAYFFVGGIIQIPSSRVELPGSRNVLLSLLFTVLLIVLFEPGRVGGEEISAETASIHLNIANTISTLTGNNMNQITTDLTTITVLLLFFILQLIIYYIGIRKIEEIRKTRNSSVLKLKLIDNEDNLFDSGLYVGLGGTVASLILLAMDVVSASLVAAYASTLFGILFVAILKIFHVRPYKKRLIINSETEK